MPIFSFFHRNQPWLLGVAGLGIWFLPMAEAPLEAEPFSIIGAQAWGPLPSAAEAADIRLSVFETDAWQHSLKDGALRPAPQLPLPKGLPTAELLRGIEFTPDTYLEQIKTLRQGYCRQRNILMYYGGIRYRPERVGLNFNAWSGQDLQRLRELDARPFIGLEIMDRHAIRAMAWRLKEAGYTKKDRIYVRIGSEPSYSHYGSEDGTRTGKRKTPVAHDAFKARFTRAALEIRAMNRRLGLNMQTVFAGANNEDFLRYIPEPWLFDALGFNLYLTPENKHDMVVLLRTLAKRYPDKPLVIPEFGVATAGPAKKTRNPELGLRKKEVLNETLPRSAPPVRFSSPQWAVEALGDMLVELVKHPGGVGEITVFSVNVAGRMKERRWNWAWTPQMYEMLREWQMTPHLWQKTGYHRYDPASYPVGKDVLFVNRPNMRVVYRKLAATLRQGVPMYEEIIFFRQSADDPWTHRSQVVSFSENATITHRKYTNERRRSFRIL